MILYRRFYLMTFKILYRRQYNSVIRFFLLKIRGYIQIVGKI